MAMKPDNPEKDGATFEYWVTSDGKEFDFNTILTKSVTLYAKWEGEDVRTIIPAADIAEKSINLNPYIAYGTAGLLVVASVIGCILFIRKGGKKYGGNK